MFTRPIPDRPRSRRFLHDNRGKIVLAQWPNFPIAAWFVSNVASRVLPDGDLATGLDHLSRAALLTWAYLEITDGVNYFRRLLGTIVMIALVVTYLRG